MALKYKLHDPVNNDALDVNLPFPLEDECSYCNTYFVEGTKVFYYSWNSEFFFCKRSCAKTWLGDARAGLIPGVIV
jgi:hypothetical protein